MDKSEKHFHFKLILQYFFTKIMFKAVKEGNYLRAHGKTKRLNKVRNKRIVKNKNSKKYYTNPNKITCLENLLLSIQSPITREQIR